LSQPFQVAEAFTGKLGQFVELEETITGFRDIVAGKYDHLPEMAFYMVGNIDTAIAKAHEIAEELARSNAMTAAMAKGAADKLKGGDDKRAAFAGEYDYLVGALKPTLSEEEIRKELYTLAMECKARDLKTAADIKALDDGTDDLQRGWKFPKEDQILSSWKAWEEQFQKDTNIVASMITFLFDSKNRRAAEEAAEIAEFGSVSN